MFAIYLLLVHLLAVVSAAATLPSQCGCGYKDPETLSVYTDSIIVYFNETDTIDPDLFSLQDFAHRKEKGWNAVYKTGARPENVKIINDTAFHPRLQVLELLTNATDSNHLVNGAMLQSVRRDMQFGSFQAALKPANKWTGGTALSFMLKYNDSQSLEMDFMNMDDPADAKISTLVNGEWPASDIVTNVTIMQEAGLDPWHNFTDVRMVWNKTDVSFYIADNQTRAITKKDRTLPLAGQPLQLKTWSTGDSTYMEGPPMHNATKSHVLYVRAFFNSSTMSTAEHDTFNDRCATGSFCLTSDINLRGSTAYSPASELKWKEIPNDRAIRKVAGIVAACCSSFGVFALINVFLRRTPWEKLRPGKRDADFKETPTGLLRRSLTGATSSSKAESDRSSEEAKVQKGYPFSGTSSGVSTPGAQTPLPAYGAQTPRSGYQTPAPAYENPPPLPTQEGGLYRSVSLASLPRVPSLPQMPAPADEIVSKTSSESNSVAKNSSDKDEIKVLDRIEEAPHHEQPLETARRTPNPFADTNAIVNPFDEKSAAITVSEKGKESAVTTTAVDPEKTTKTAAAGTKDPAKPPAKVQIDYLAGLVAVACLGVSLHHFCQTFWPWVAEGYGNGAHYPKAEKYLAIIVGSIILTQLWIGPFFLTATRFLSSNYLKNGNLIDIAKKILRRAPRLFIPIGIVSGLQYFLISMNLTASLEWLPSVSWSTWPYVVAQPNFGAFLNNLFELAYLMPNAIPEIVTHYCIGVLWTVPVQLQFTYVVLAGAVLIRDIKNPWKRFGFYTLMILSGWYAKSWSACHWCGLLLSDLENTYKWKNYLNKHPVVRYLVIAVSTVLALGSCMVGAFNQEWSFNTLENGLHPDNSVGKPITDVDPVYPGYNEPTLTILLFSIGLQIVVELSTWVQAFLSLKVILWMRPHVMTIYLTHGFVMWTWGAWVAVSLNTAGVPYYANLIVTVVTTYALIFLLASILTPLMEFPTQAAMRNLDRWVKDEPKPKRPTTAPFGKEIVLNREGNDSPAGES